MGYRIGDALPVRLPARWRPPLVLGPGGRQGISTAPMRTALLWGPTVLPRRRGDREPLRVRHRRQRRTDRRGIAPTGLTGRGSGVDDAVLDVRDRRRCDHLDRLQRRVA